MNSKFVFKKYNLDVSDVDKIKNTYKVKAYPTFIILDGNGKEVGRMEGAPTEAKKFMEHISNALSKVKKSDEGEETTE